MTMKVTATLKAEGNDPKEVTWARDTDAVGAIECVAQLTRMDKDESPWSPRILDIHITL